MIEAANARRDLLMSFVSKVVVGIDANLSERRSKKAKDMAKGVANGKSNGSAGEESSSGDETKA